MCFASEVGKSHRKGFGFRPLANQFLATHPSRLLGHAPRRCASPSVSHLLHLKQIPKEKLKRRKGQGALNAKQMGPSSHPNNTLSMLGFIWVCAGLPEADSCDTLPAPQLPPPAASPVKCLSVATWIMTWERYGKIRSDRALCAAQSAEDVPVTIENMKEHLRKITRSGRLCHDIEDLLRRNHKSKACQKRY